VDKSTFDQIQRTADKLRLVISQAEEPDDPFGQDEWLGPLEEGTAPAARQPIKLHTLPELYAQRAAAPWLVKHVIPGDSIGMIFGGSGAFKSFIAIDLACHVSHGLQWLGRKTTKGHVVYVAAEGAGGIWKRFKAWHMLHGMTEDEALIHVITVPVDMLSDAKFIVEAVRKAGLCPSLIIVDTMSQTFSGNENSAQEVSNYMRTLGAQFRAEWHCAVAIVHHTGHSATERPRGSSAMLPNVDWMYGVFRDGDSMSATVECAKQKDAEKLPDIEFTLTVHEVGVDEDGDKETSLAASIVDDTHQSKQDILKELKSGRGGDRATLLGLATDGLKEKELREAFYKEVDKSPEAQRKAFTRAFEYLKRNGLIFVQNGRIVLPGQS
jgi:RecA-family ATPase